MPHGQWQLGNGNRPAGFVVVSCGCGGLWLSQGSLRGLVLVVWFGGLVVVAAGIWAAVQTGAARLTSLPLEEVLCEQPHPLFPQVTLALDRPNRKRLVSALGVCACL